MTEDSGIKHLRADLAAVHTDVEAAGARTLERWSSRLDRAEFEASARNLAHYLALRAHDHTDLQRRLRLVGWGTFNETPRDAIPGLPGTC